MSQDLHLPVFRVSLTFFGSFTGWKLRLSSSANIFRDLLHKGLAKAAAESVSKHNCLHKHALLAAGCHGVQTASRFILTPFFTSPITFQRSRTGPFHMTQLLFLFAYIALALIDCFLNSYFPDLTFLKSYVTTSSCFIFSPWIMRALFQWTWKNGTVFKFLWLDGTAASCRKLMAKKLFTLV